jgi:predicted  nucleic acid-binding Zn-ribbon protein
MDRLFRFWEERLSQEIERLWELQTVYTQLADREKQLTVKPESFASVDREWQAANEEVTRLEQSIENLSKERRRVDGELSDQQELLKKYQGNLMQVKNQQQYAAAWKEIDATRKHVKELEDSVLKSMTESEAIQAQLDERRTNFEPLKGLHDEEYASWQSSLGDLRTEIGELKAKQEQIEAQIPPRLKNEFWRVAKQRNNVAVARVDFDTCSACRTRVRAMVAQQLKRGETVQCEGCRRILYLERPIS